MYKATADDLHLELDLEQYKKTRQIQDVDLIPTEKTDSLLARWKDVSEIFPSLDFPKKDIEKEDWIKVHEVLINNRGVMEEISTEIANEADATADWQAVNNYIHFGEASPSYFKSYLENEGIENPGWSSKVTW